MAKVGSVETTKINHNSAAEIKSPKIKQPNFAPQSTSGFNGEQQAFQTKLRDGQFRANLLRFQTESLFLKNAASKSNESSAADNAPNGGDVPERYAGGTLPVKIESKDMPQTFVHRGLRAHAAAGGLGETEAAAFADQWTNSKTTFNHRAGGISTPYTAPEFQTLKAAGEVLFHLTKEFDALILADLNQRLAADTVEGGTATAYATEPLSTSGLRKDGMRLDEETALTRFIYKHYGEARSVAGDKINGLAIV